MFPFTYLRRHAAMRRMGRGLEKATKRWIYRAVARGSRQSRPATPEALHGARRVLLVRPNFRIGNAVIGARLIQAFAEGCPEIDIDYLGTDTTRVLFAGMPLAQYHAVSRSMLVRPWQLARLVVRLRRRNYDLAVQLGDSSLTSWLLIQCCGARKSLGQRGRLEASHDWVSDVPSSHVYELVSGLAASLGLACVSRPWLVVSEQERGNAVARLTSPTGRRASIGIFVGGHLDKRLPLEFWQDLLRNLERRRQPYVVLVGPEESALRAPLASSTGEFGHVLPQMPLREFLGVLANLRRLITPDTGPMHMAVALEVPVLALLQVKGSRKFSPQGEADLVLFRPTATEVAERICATPGPDSSPPIDDHHGSSPSTSSDTTDRQSDSDMLSVYATGRR